MNRRTELCGKALEYFLDHGAADISLRPLAEAIGTSARLLIFHFESKDGLISAVMDALRQQMQQSFRELHMASRAADSMLAFFTWATSPRNIRHIRLLFEMQVLALRNPAQFGAYVAGGNASWLELVSASLPASPERRATATLYVAVIDGLLLDFFTTGDLAASTDALRAFIKLIEAPRAAAT